jgi:hypothetical protein
MKYIRNTSFGSLLPKVAGSYEEPIHAWIESAVKHGYERVINIGCAEGYYAVGMALRLPESTIYAYDIDGYARELLSELAQRNNVENRIIIKKECSSEELGAVIQGNTLIICDIEGGERELLDPDTVPQLKQADLIVEAHDFIHRGITEEIVRRFHDFSIIHIAVDYPFRIFKYSVDKIEIIASEKRPTKDMKWVYIKHRGQHF